MALRPFLSELGCIPISKVTCYTEPSSLFDDQGALKDAAAKIHVHDVQLQKQLTELEWMATVLKSRWGIGAAFLKLPSLKFIVPCIEVRLLVPGLSALIFQMLKSLRLRDQDRPPAFIFKRRP